MNDKIRILLVDDHAMLRKGMALLLGEEADTEVIGEACDGEQAIAQARELKPDVVVMDINMPRLNGIEATRQIVAESPDSKVIALSINSGKHFVDDMLSAGAVGYLLKESVPEELLLGIRAVMGGDMYLSSATTSTVVSAYVEGISREQDNRPETDFSILQTKLHRPAAPLHLVPRTCLHEKLDAGRVQPLILVSAPAGYGKSILISSWLETNDYLSGWLSLDKGDSNLHQFLSYFLAEIQSAFPNACENTLSMLSAPQFPSLRTLAGSLANELDEIKQPCILVLDDYHQIDTSSPVNKLLNLLLKYPPISLHLVIVTRRDPPLQLLKLRAQGQITEFRMADLSFTLQETRELLEQSVEFTASDEALTNLQHEMEGWVVGLQLITLTLCHIGDPNQFLINLQGGQQQTQEYLIKEVLDRQSPSMHDWLLKTTILDRFCASLCDAVCSAELGNEKPEIEGDKFIKKVFYSNLFAIPQDVRGEWFRYHHLFQQMLQLELAKDMSAGEIAGLHLRASEWFESRGLIDEAIQHALKANEGAGAAEIIEQHYQSELNQHRWYIVERWLTMLPLEIIEQKPRLLLAQMWGLYNKHHMLEIPPLIEQVESILVNEAADEDILGELNFYRGFMLTMFHGDAEGALIEFEQARKRFSESQARIIECELEIVDAIAHQMAGKGALSIQSLNQRIHAIGASKGLLLSRLVAAPVFSLLLSGNLKEVIPAAQHFTSVCKNTELTNSEGSSLYLRASADLQSYHLDEALHGFQSAVQKRDILHRRIAIDSQVGLVLTNQALQRSDDASTAIKQLMMYALDTGEPEHIAVAQSCQARLSLLQGDDKPAIEWARSFDVEAHAPSMFMWLEVPVITYLRVLISTDSQENLQQASESLVTLYKSVEVVHNTYQMIQIQVLQCVALKKLERVDEALDVLQQVVKLAQPGGWVRPFVELGLPMVELLSRFTEKKGSTEYLRCVLDHCLTSAEQQVDSAVDKPHATSDNNILILEQLTKREYEALELLAQRLQNKEIAARLFISPETVKYHLKNLYQKLYVSNRRDAVLKAIEIKAAGVARAADQAKAE